MHLLSEAGLDVPLFSQSFSEHSLNLVVRELNQAHCLNVLRTEFGDSVSPAQVNAAAQQTSQTGAVPELAQAA